MVILATRSREIGTNPLLDANCTFDANKDREFSIKIIPLISLKRYKCFLSFDRRRTSNIFI